MDDMSKKFGVALTTRAHAKMREIAKVNKLGQNYILNILFENWDALVDAKALGKLVEQTKAVKPKRRVSTKMVKGLLDKLSPEERAKLMEQMADEAT